MTNVASFVAPLNQFESGESTEECVAFGAADIFYSGPPNGSPTGTAEQIDQLADLWYAKLGNNGMSLQAEYAMLKGLGLQYTPLPPTTHDVIASLANTGYPVLITGAEAGFFDVGLNKIPYAWDYNLYNHAIVACGVTSDGNIYVRDYANVQAEPGSIREYNASKMTLISATAVKPRWMVPPVTGLVPTSDDLHVWGSKAVLNPSSAIGQSWLVGRWKHNFNFGAAQETEQDMTAYYKSPTRIVEQEFLRGRASWHESTGKTTWYDGRGVIGVL
jgi:Papain-like cysteine protease AvrRpt2